MLFLPDGRAINLAELAHAITADHALCRRITEAACREFDRACLSVEQAVVLLGRERLASQLSLSNPGLRLESFPRKSE